MNEKEMVEHVWDFGFGGMIKPELEYLFAYCKDKTILELGSEVGQSSYVMATVAKSVTCVDVWDDNYEHLNHDIKQKDIYLNDKKFYKDKKINKENIFEQFKKNCKEFIDSGKIKTIKGLTDDVANKFEDESFDVILIDADHSYSGVHNDIINYCPKLKKNGILLFHDYKCGTWTGVTTAIDEAILANKIKYITHSDRIGVFKLKE